MYLKMGRNDRAAALFERSLAAWQKVSPADYEADKVNETDAQLKDLEKAPRAKIFPRFAQAAVSSSA